MVIGDETVETSAITVTDLQSFARPSHCTIIVTNDILYSIFFNNQRVNNVNSLSGLGQVVHALIQWAVSLSS